MADLMLHLTKPHPGQEDPLDARDPRDYLPAVLAIDGVQSARRFRAAEDQANGAGLPFTHLICFDIVEGGLPRVAQRLITAGLLTSEDGDGVARAWCFTEISPRVASADAGDGPFDQMVVLSNAREGTDTEFNRWYDRVHIPDVLTTIGGFVGAHRFRRTEVAINRDCPWAYLALYDIPEGRIAYCLERLQWSRIEREEAITAGRAPKVPVAPVMAEDRVSWFYRRVLPDPATA